MTSNNTFLNPPSIQPSTAPVSQSVIGVQSEVLQTNYQHQQFQTQTYLQQQRLNSYLSQQYSALFEILSSQSQHSYISSSNRLHLQLGVKRSATDSFQLSTTTTGV